MNKFMINSVICFESFRDKYNAEQWKNMWMRELTGFQGQSSYP